MERKDIKEMTDREIAEETLAMLRAFGDALEAATSNPMIRAMMPKVNL